MDLTTRYMGLTLRNPLIASASPLNRDVGNLRRLEDAGAGEHVAPHEDLGGVLGVDDLRAAGHRQHVVGEQRPQREVGRADRRDDDAALRPADQVVVGEPAAVRMVLPTDLQGQRVVAALRVGELHALLVHVDHGVVCHDPQPHLGLPWRRTGRGQRPQCPRRRTAGAPLWRTRRRPALPGAARCRHLPYLTDQYTGEVQHVAQPARRPGRRSAWDRSTRPPGVPCPTTCRARGARSARPSVGRA